MQWGGSRHPSPWAETPPGQTPPGQTPRGQTPPPPGRQRETASEADGAHPTGIHSCEHLERNSTNSVRWLSFLHCSPQKPVIVIVDQKFRQLQKMKSGECSVLKI